MTNKPFRAVGERFELAGLIYEVEAIFKARY